MPVTIETKINAIVARDSGVPYPEVIDGLQITPNQFYSAVRDIEDLLSCAPSETTNNTLAEISEDKSRRKELFRMGEEFVAAQYDRIRSGSGQKRFYNGTYDHSENVQNIVYHALTSDKPDLKKTRQELIEGIKHLPKDLKKYLRRIGLGGLMENAFEEREKNSPLAVLKAFDRAYMEKTGDKSLFDLTQEHHLHEWGDTFNAPHSYWQNPENVKTAVYHTLTEQHPKLAKSRQELIEEVKGLPGDLKEYFGRIGLSSLMVNAFKKGEQSSPLAVLKVFDRVYVEKTGDKSLFDLEQEHHLHEWGDTFRAPKSYWQNPENVKTAVYHTLTEQHPELAKSRQKVIDGIKNLPSNLGEYFHNFGLGGLMGNAFQEGEIGSPLAVLKVFDRVYVEKTGDKSLFDLQQEHHLHEWGDTFQAPNSYWQDTENVKTAVYHTLTEERPALLGIRTDIVEVIKNLPSNLRDYFHDIGLKGLMLNAFKKGEVDSPLAVLRVFDDVYMKKTGGKSLFDKTQGNYLQFDSRNRLVR